MTTLLPRAFGLAFARPGRLRPSEWTGHEPQRQHCTGAGELTRPTVPAPAPAAEATPPRKMRVLPAPTITQKFPRRTRRATNSSRKRRLHTWRRPGRRRTPQRRVERRRRHGHHSRERAGKELQPGHGVEAVQRQENPRQATAATARTKCPRWPVRSGEPAQGWGRSSRSRSRREGTAA